MGGQVVKLHTIRSILRATRRQTLVLLSTLYLIKTRGAEEGHLPEAPSKSDSNTGLMPTPPAQLGPGSSR